MDDHESKPPEGLIEGDDWGDIIASCMLSNKCQGRVYACGVTRIRVNYGKKHHRCLAGMATVMHELHNS